MSALAAGVAAIVVATVPVLGAAVAYAVVVSSVAARLLSNETAQVRRDWARDRAVTAHERSREQVRRSREQVAFADSMGEKVQVREERIVELLQQLGVAEAALVEAEARHAAVTVRADGLQVDLDETRQSLVSTRAEVRRLRDDLAASQSSELAARTELMAWQEAEEHRRLA